MTLSTIILVNKSLTNKSYCNIDVVSCNPATDEMLNLVHYSMMDLEQTFNKAVELSALYNLLGTVTTYFEHGIKDAFIQSQQKAAATTNDNRPHKNTSLTRSNFIVPRKKQNFKINHIPLKNAPCRI